MLGRVVSSSSIVNQAQASAQSALYQARLHKETKNVDMALILYGQAKVAFKYIAKARGLTPSLSEIKDAVFQAKMPQTAEDEALRKHIAEVYLERSHLLEQLGDSDKARASYQKAQAWGHLDVVAQPSTRLTESTLQSAALTGHSVVSVQSGETRPFSAQQTVGNSSSPILAETPSILIGPAQSTEFPIHLSEGVQEKNKLVNQLFEKTLQTFQELKLENVLPSAFLVYAHDNPHYGTADASTAKFLIDQLFKLGINMYSDQTPKGLQAQASFSTPQDAARTDDILTSQLCLLPSAVGSIQSVNKVIVCGSQVLAHYLQWKYYQDYCKELKEAYVTSQQNPAQVEAQIRQVVNTYVKYPGFHHVLTEMAFLKIRAEYRKHHHGIIPVSLSAGGSKSCCQDFIQATAVRIEDFPRFASQQASGQLVYKNQGRHLAFFKVFERLLSRHDSEALLRVFWAGYAALIERLNNEAATPQITDYLPVWDKLFEDVRTTLQTLKEQVDEHELKMAFIRYASLDQLAIQRLSGPQLSMEYCYINLAIIEHKKVRKEEENAEETKEKKESSKDGNLMPNSFRRLPSAEAIDYNLQKLISLEQLFESRELSDGKKVTPKRILIRGRAGVGKTTLSKKIAYEYTQNDRWRDRFDYLLRIPLRMLKGKQHCDWVTLFHEVYFHTHPNGLALARVLEAQIRGPAKEKTLFVLDGWDEVAQEWGERGLMAEFLKDLLNQPMVLITSRPHVELKQINAMDLELETIGFSPKDVVNYLDNPSIMSVSQAKEMKHFIKANALVKELVNVPIQLDALCYSWDEIRRLWQEAPDEMTITALYQAMMNKLWRKDMLRLSKRESGVLLPAEAVNALRRTSRIEQAVQIESNFLSALAFHGLQSGRIEFDTTYLDNLIEQLMREGMSLPLTLEANLKKLSFLHTDDVEESQQSYHFMHLTFQEFFAAKYFVAHWEKKWEVTLLSMDTQRWMKVPPEAFVRQHKYNPRYEIFWWFVSGLLRGEALEDFFALLETEPRDLVGASHQRLMMSCLHEASRAPGVGLPSGMRKELEEHLVKWLRWEVDKKYACTLAYRSTFPEQMLLDCLKNPGLQDAKRAITTALGYRSALSKSARDVLIDLAQGGDEVAVKALGQQASRSESALKAVIELTKNRYKKVKYAAAEVLGELPSLSESALKALIEMTDSSDMKLKYVVARALGKPLSLPESILQALLTLAQDGDKDQNVRRAVAEILGKLPLLPESVLQALLELVKEENWNVRFTAVKSLDNRFSESESALHTLLRLVKEENWNVRCAAAESLGKLPSLSESALQPLLALTQGQDQNVKRAAAEAWGGLHSLPEFALQALCKLGKDDSWQVRLATAKALAKRFPRSKDALLSLIELAGDEEGWSVRCAVAKALIKLPSLPESALQDLLKLAQNDSQDYYQSDRCAAIEALGKLPSLSEPTLKVLILLARDEHSELRHAAAKALGEQCARSESAFSALHELTEDQSKLVRLTAFQVLGKLSLLTELERSTLLALKQDQDISVRLTAFQVLGKLSLLPESDQLALLELAQSQKSDVRRDVVEALSELPTLPESVLRTLLRLAQEDNNVKHTAVRILGKHRWTLYRLLPKLNRQQIELTYTEFLRNQPFAESMPCYIQDDTLCFYTAEGLQTVPLGDEKNEFKEAILQAQRAAGVPLPINRVVPTDAQNAPLAC